MSLPDTGCIRETIRDAALAPRQTSRPIRFLQISSFYPPYSFGGDAAYVQRLSHALAEMDHQVDIIHCVDSYLMFTSSNAKPENDTANLRVHGLRSGYGVLSPLLSHQSGRPLLKTTKIREIIDRVRPDVIHYHNISLLGPAVLELGSDSEVIKLYTAHEHWLICPNHVLWKFNRKPCDGPKCLPCVLRAKRPPQLWRYTNMLERCANEVDAFLAFSRFTANIHRSRGFSRPVLEFPPFVDLAESTGSSGSFRAHDSANKPYFLFVGRLEPIKGVEFLVDAWGDAVGAELLIAGDGSLRNRLRQMASAKRSVRILGKLSSAELGELYANCIACIVPSLTYEVFPMVILEAFARKAPVIARDLGSLSDIINDSGGGMLFNDAAGLMRCVSEVESSRELRQQLGNNGFRAFLARWTREHHLKRYFELLRSIALTKFGHVPWEK
jgi:glycosyltransferase involved in cell wall biosynthesis